MSGAILVLNSGSSSIKFAVYARGGGLLIRGKVAGIGGAPRFLATGQDGSAIDPGALAQIGAGAGHAALVPLILDWLRAHCGDAPFAAVGHRVVHGGRGFASPVLIDDTVLEQLDALVPLAPLHQPHNLSAIRAVAARHPDLPQIACFDTSFHRTQDHLAQLFALPRALTDAGVIRYGFHGLSYEYIAGVLPDHIGPRGEGRVIVAHLGNGASMCAMNGRRSVATSMGFTALDGLMMGQRCGALDPGVVLYLMQGKGMTAAEVETLLYHQSGLLGVSGISNNMRDLEQSTDPHAREAIALFCYRAAEILGGLVTATGGLDALVFTAGIGENSAQTRALICDRLGYLGVRLDAGCNERSETCISSSASSVDVLVIPTDEGSVIARATADMIAAR